MTYIGSRPIQVARPSARDCGRSWGGAFPKGVAEMLPRRGVVVKGLEAPLQESGRKGSRRVVQRRKQTEKTLGFVEWGVGTV